MAVGEALVHVRITVLQLCLGTLLFLSGWAQSGHSQHQSPPETVIPLRITVTNRGMRPANWLSYSLHFGGQRHIIHMKTKKLLVSKPFSVFTYTDQGALLEEQPFVQSDCYYHGYVEGDPESLVALSTCSGGFRGMLEIHDTLYEIKPKRLSARFEHLVYRIDREETQFPPMRCGLTEEEIAQQLKLLRESDITTLKQSDYKGWWTHKGLIELAAVVDYERYRHLDSNISKVEDEVILVMHAANEYYKALQIDLIFYGLEVWNKENPITISSLGDTLSAFCTWKKRGFNARIHHDAVHLLIKKSFGKLLGLAFVGTICNILYNCAVDSFEGDSISTFAYVVAHELGHNLGMRHDANTCSCGQKTCIMYPSKTVANKFSNCSYANFWDIGSRKSCMHDTPNPEAIFSKIQCGNGVTEKGEECDCGSLKLCLEDPCCAGNCTLEAGAVCTFGLCCKDCQFLPSGTECRIKENECDLPEWCNGTSHECPRDVYVQDGIPCMNGGNCYEKRCNIRDEQCKQIFGLEARSASESCYIELNTRGDRFGNCGLNNHAYIKCNMSDAFCGRVLCENVMYIPYLRDHYTVHSTNFNGITCWGTDYHPGMTIPDIGEVTDGTVCGEEYVCIRKKCVPISVWESDCTPMTCNNNGVCNNKQNCHCNREWDPPNCLLQGHGGSVDSGPPPPRILPNIEISKTALLLSLWIPTLLLFCCWTFAIWRMNRAH
ncbi:Disintegrin and metalloproteinase domain-containing protein 25 [Sciurus carolinensis]|uniref:Disintegrin and metalloproteinase domain-containing protein 25 n=1 Tax=Sciurus carolinensis TaxID=30640 RepID=A0AA41SYY2_SCICA|nr:Disintegrin and metalloproteinase domain-containing protein 25 [Sciurus carolinensis]